MATVGVKELIFRTDTIITKKQI